MKKALKAKRILIISSGEPFKGGQSTTAYNLLKKLQDEFEVRLFYLNKKENQLLDPHRVGKVHSINLNHFSSIFRIPSYLNQRLGSLRFNKAKIKQLIGSKKRLSSNLYSLGVYLKLVKLSFKPDIVISNVPRFFPILKNIHAKNKWIIINGSMDMTVLANYGIDAQSFLEKPSTFKQINPLNYDFNGINVLFNSDLTKQVYQGLGVKFDNHLIRHFNILPPKDKPLIPFTERNFDIGFFVSNQQRKIKNAALAQQIFEAFPNQKKLMVGQGSSAFAEINNTTTMEIVPQSQVLELMVQVRLVIIPSYYDSSPGVLTEAISQGCNVLVSKNIGWNEHLESESVVQNYFDNNEWIEKTANLLTIPTPHPSFSEIIKHSNTGLVDFFHELSIEPPTNKE
jgi:hypothetical protein